LIEGSINGVCNKPRFCMCLDVLRPRHTYKQIRHTAAFRLMTNAPFSTEDGALYVQQA